MAPQQTHIRETKPQTETRPKAKKQDSRRHGEVEFPRKKGSPLSHRFRLKPPLAPKNHGGNLRAGGLTIERAANLAVGLTSFNSPDGELDQPRPTRLMASLINPIRLVIRRQGSVSINSLLASPSGLD
ncbi:hypothetical protein DY000_02060840 [Brassica cretica]|uniref:Uncharacterized protein n=1 Tax=Brassica cretica TaxID=69181 RepID=A0ABQ7B408_BRACR|nr:hypothetical protein DY000_02060840 [Brassica cretica]